MFRKRDLSGEEYAYIWVDGVHFNIRLEEDRLCTLVVLGVRADGTKELLATDALRSALAVLPAEQSTRRAELEQRLAEYESRLAAPP